MYLAQRRRYRYCQERIEEKECLTISTEWVYSLCVGDGCENARKGGPSGSGKDLSITDISKSQWLKEFDNGILCTAHDLQ